MGGLILGFRLPREQEEASYSQRDGKKVWDLRPHLLEASILHPHDVGQTLSLATASQGRGEAWAAEGQRGQAMPQRCRHRAPEQDFCSLYLKKPKSLSI